LVGNLTAKSVYGGGERAFRSSTQKRKGGKEKGKRDAHNIKAGGGLRTNPIPEGKEANTPFLQEVIAVHDERRQKGGNRKNPQAPWKAHLLGQRPANPNQAGRLSKEKGRTNF